MPNQISLKAHRVNCGFTLKEAANKLGISTDTLVNWEKGRTFPDARMIKKIEVLYRTHYDFIFFG